MVGVVILIVIMLRDIILNVVMLGVVILIVRGIMLSVIMLCAVILIVIMLRYINYADCRHAEYHNRAIHPNT
jgi:hypothetical protein